MSRLGDCRYLDVGLINGQTHHLTLPIRETSATSIARALRKEAVINNPIPRVVRTIGSLGGVKPMRITFKKLRRLGLGLLIALALILIVLWVWVIPRAIVAAIREHHGGYVTIAGWWVNGSSAGVTGLTLHEGPEPSSPVWLVSDRVATDLTLWGLLRGRFAPSRIVFRHPSIRYRIDAEGNPLTRIILRHSGSGPIPELIAEDGQLAMRQADWPEMLVAHLDGRLAPDPAGPRFEVQADDPAWGRPALNGRFSPDLASSELRLTADDLVADRDKEARIPFVDPNVWQFFDAERSDRDRARLCAALRRIGTAPGEDDGDLPEDDRSSCRASDMVGDEVTGRAMIHDKIVSWRMCAVGWPAAGPPWPAPSISRTWWFDINLALGLDGVDLDDLPPSWDLDRRGVKGRITATTALRMSLSPRGLDLTGSTGSGRLDGAVFQGLPLQRTPLDDAG